MGFKQSKAGQVFWKLAERIILLLDPLSTLRLVQALVLDKHILEKSISSTVWNKLIRKGSFGGDALLRRDVNSEANEGARSSSASTSGCNLSEVPFSWT